MITCHKRSPAPGIVGGVVLIVIGTVLLLGRFGLLDLGDVFRFWPALLIVFGVGRMITAQDDGNRVVGSLFAIAGAILLLNRLGYTSLRLLDLWPLAIIGLGVALLVGALSSRPAHRSGPSSLNWLDLWTVFGGIKVVNDSQSFEGGNLVAIFGGCQVDLSRAALATDTVIVTVYPIFGGIELRVPLTWKIVLQGSPIFGGFEDKTAHPLSDSNLPQPTLILRGMPMFGGVEVKN